MKALSLLPGNGFKICDKHVVILAALFGSLPARLSCREELLQVCPLSDNGCQGWCWQDNPWNSFMAPGPQLQALPRKLIH